MTGSPLRLDAETFAVYAGEQRLDVQLTPTEATLLAFLLQDGRPFRSVDEIGAAVWGYTETGGESVRAWESSMVHTIVSRLRGKLQNASGHTGLLKNVRGLGYQLTWPEKQETDEDPAPAASSTAQESPAASSDPGLRRQLVRAMPVLMTVLAAAIFAASVAYNRSARAGDESLVPGLQRFDGAAVLVEDFSDPLNGLLPERDSGPVRESGFRDGAYYVDFAPTAEMTFVRVPVKGDYANARIEVRARFSGAPAQRWIAVGCRNRTEKPTTGYMLRIDTVEQRVEIVFRDLMRNQTVLASVRSDAVKAGNATNHLQLQCVDSWITAIVNDEAVLSVNDTTETGPGGLWFGVGADAGELDTSVTFDDLRVFYR